MLPNLSALSKTFQIGSLNYFRIKHAINRCKTKIQEIERKGDVWAELEKDLKGRLKSLEISLTEYQEKRIKSLVGKYTSSICQNLMLDFQPIPVKYLALFQFSMLICFQLNHLLLLVFTEMTRYHV